jgi:hypothetical protein
VPAELEGHPLDPLGRQRAADLAAGMVIGEFHGVNAATGPTG